GLGAAELIDRAALAAKPPRPLDRERWAGAVDAGGGATLATVLTQLKYRAGVAACGLAGGSDLPATVIPFLLRGVNLLGIDSWMCPREERTEAWQRLARHVPLDRLERMTEAVPLSSLPDLAPKILKGEIRGRIVVEVARLSTWNSREYRRVSGVCAMLPPGPIRSPSLAGHSSSSACSSMGG